MTRPLPVVSGTAVLDLAGSSTTEQRNRAAQLAQLWPGTRVEVEVGTCSLWDVHHDVVVFLTDAAVARSLHLDFRGTPGAVQVWTRDMRARIGDHLAGAAS